MGGDYILEAMAPQGWFSTSDYREACEGRDRHSSRNRSPKLRGTVEQYPREFMEAYSSVLREFKKKHQYDLVWCSECGEDFLRKYTERYQSAFCTCDVCIQKKREYNQWCHEKTRCETCGRKVKNKEMAGHQASHADKRRYAEELLEYGRGHVFLQTVVTKGKHKGKTAEQILAIDPEYFSRCEAFTRSDYFKDLAEKWYIFEEVCDDRKEIVRNLQVIRQNIIEKYSWEFIEVYQGVLSEFKEEYTYVLVSCHTCNKKKWQKYSKTKQNISYQCTRCKREEKQVEYERFLQQKLTRGKYSGKTIGETLEIKPDYLFWCAQNTSSSYFKRIVNKLLSFED